MMKEMKNSGIEWIGEIPADWNIAKYKYFTTNRMGETILASDTLESGIPIYSATQEDKIFGYTESANLILKKGDFVIPARGNSIGCVSIVSQDIATCTQTTICSRDIHNINSKFLYYCCYGLKSEWFKYEGSAIPQITVEQVKNNIVPVPPLTEQKKIADFLDNKVSEIDKMIAETKSSIENYKEYKSAIIDETITKGNFPQYKFRYLGELKNGLNYHSASDEKTIKFLGVGDFKNFMVLDNIDCFSDLPIDTEISDEYFLKSGDIVFVRSNGSKELVGRSIMVDNIDYDLTYSGFCIRFRNGNSEKVRNKYLLYFFRSEYFKECLKQGSSGMAINNLSQDILNSVRVPIPPIEKQDEIINYLDSKCIEIDNLIFEKEALVSNLEEYKKALIYEYVTGKKTV